MTEPTHLKIYPFDEAPEEYKALSQHGGDEDILVYCPAAAFDFYWGFQFDELVRLMEVGRHYLFHMGWVDGHKLDNGDYVYILAHA